MIIQIEGLFVALNVLLRIGKELKLLYVKIVTYLLKKKEKKYKEAQIIFVQGRAVGHILIYIKQPE